MLTIWMGPKLLEISIICNLVMETNQVVVSI